MIKILYSNLLKLCVKFAGQFYYFWNIRFEISVCEHFVRTIIIFVISQCQSASALQVFANLKFFDIFEDSFLFVYNNNKNLHSFFHKRIMIEFEMSE